MIRGQPFSAILLLPTLQAAHCTSATYPPANTAALFPWHPSRCGGCLDTNSTGPSHVSFYQVSKEGTPAFIPQGH